MDLKSCSKCGKIHPRGQECKTKRIYRDTEERKARSSWAWTKKAKQIKDDAHGLCEVCLAEGIYTYDGLEVHHIVKIRDNKDGLLDDDNLITLCTYHHKKADAGEIDPDYLKTLVKLRTLGNQCMNDFLYGTKKGTR